MYSPYHLKLINKIDLEERDYSSGTAIMEEIQEREHVDSRLELKLPAAGKTGLLIGSPDCSSVMKTAAQYSFVRQPIEGTEIEEEMKAGPSGCNLCQLDDDSPPPEDKLAVFNTNDFLKSHYDIVLKGWVVNVSKNFLFRNFLDDRAPCLLLPTNIIVLNAAKFTNVWRFFPSNLDQITTASKEAETLLKINNRTLEPLTRSFILEDTEKLKSPQLMKDMIKYSMVQYGLLESFVYASHEVTSMIPRHLGAHSSSAEHSTNGSVDGRYARALPRSTSSTASNCSEQIHFLKIHYTTSSDDRDHSLMHVTLFTQYNFKRSPLDKESPRCSKEDSDQKGVLTTSGINFGLEQLDITTGRAGSPDSALEESQGSEDGYDDTLVSDESKDSSHLDLEKSSPLLNKLQLEETLPQSTEFRQSSLCSNDWEIVDTSKDEPLKEKILDLSTRSNETYTNQYNRSQSTPLEYSQLLFAPPSHSSKDPNAFTVSNSVSGCEKGGLTNKQSSNPVGMVEVVASSNTNITKEFHINDSGYTSDNNIESESIHREKSTSSSPKDCSSGGESSSDEESTTSHFSDEAARQSSLGYHSQSSDSSFDEFNAGEEELPSVWSSHVGKSSLYKNIAEADVFSGPYKLMKYFEIYCLNFPVIMHAITPDVFLSLKNQEKRYTISRANPFLNKITKPDALAMPEMVEMAAKLGCFHGLGLAFQRLKGLGFMVQFKHTMRTGLVPEADFIKAATVGLTNFIENHHNDVSKRQFLDYLGREFGVNLSMRLNNLLTPDPEEDMKFWTLTVGDVTPRNIFIYKTKQISDTQVVRWNKSRIGNCFLDLVSLLVTLPDPRCKEVQLLSTLLSYLTALGETFHIFNMGYLLTYHVIIMSIRKAAALLVYQFLSEEDTYRGPTEQDKLYGMVWNAALFAMDPNRVNWDCPWEEKAAGP